MLVTQLNDAILCEYQIKIKHDEGDKDATLRDNFNHLLYEFERSETLADLINALNFTVESLRNKK